MTITTLKPGVQFLEGAKRPLHDHLGGDLGPLIARSTGVAEMVNATA
jgi:hypothetical protein